MIRLEMKKYNAILTEKKQKYHYHQVKMINMNFLQTKHFILQSDQKWIIEQPKFTYSPLGKAFAKQIKTIEDKGIKQVESLKALRAEENQELESIQGLFQKSWELLKLKLK